MCWSRFESDLWTSICPKYKCLIKAENTDAKKNKSRTKFDLKHLRSNITEHWFLKRKSKCRHRGIKSQVTSELQIIRSVENKFRAINFKYKRQLILKKLNMIATKKIKSLIHLELEFIRSVEHIIRITNFMYNRKLISREIKKQ